MYVNHTTTWRLTGGRQLFVSITFAKLILFSKKGKQPDSFNVANCFHKDMAE